MQPSSDHHLQSRHNGLPPVALRLCFSDIPAHGPGEVGDPVVVPNAQTPKRSGGDLEAPYPQRPRISDCGQEFPGCHCESFRDVASSSEQTPPLNYVAAATHSIADWPSFQNLCGQGDCGVLPQGDVFPDMMLASQPRGNAISRTSNVDPMSRSLLAAGAQIVDPEEFRT